MYDIGGEAAGDPPDSAEQATKKMTVTKPAAEKKPAAKSKKSAEVAPTSTAPDRDDRADFLARLIANPDDKKPRLVYADLLQERGDPRGEFIALQCTRAELPDTDARAPAIDGQIDALLKKHKKTWLAALGENKGARAEYRRGFIEKLSLDANDLLKNRDRIFGTEPIEELNVWKIDQSKTETKKSKLAPILELPLHHVRRLSLARCKLTRADFEALAEATTIGKVELLDLTNGGSARIPLAPLAQATSLPRLRELKITGCMCGDSAMIDLARAKSLRFSRLHAQRNDLTGKCGKALAEATWAPELEHLDLSSNEMFGIDGIRALTSSTKLTKLRALLLVYCGFVMDSAGAELAKSPVIANLDHLDLSQTVSREDLAAIRAVLGDRLK